MVRAPARRVWGGDKKDLRTGRSIWQVRRTAQPPHCPLDRDVQCDALIIGAGITGALVADGLAAAGLKVVIADKRGPARGATTASTAMVQYEIDTPLTKLAGKLGKRDAIRAWRRSRLAVDKLAARLAELDVPDVTRRCSLYLPGNVLDPEGLAREHEARSVAGLASRLLNRKEMKHFGIAKPAALMSYDDLVIDPRRTTFALLQAACGNRARIYAPVEIVDVAARASGVTATAANGHRVKCRHVVFATGYELPKGVPRRGYRLASTWVIATIRQPRRLWPGECTIWQAADPYLYLRTTSDGRVICGGEDEDFSDEEARDRLLPCKTKILTRKLGLLVPGIDTKVEFAWTGTFGQTTNGLPIIDRMPHMPNCWIALGYGGNGISYAQMAADIICGALTRRPSIDADLYRFPD